ncbi:MAG: hypothetical protein K8I82_10990, partial [Anaerolineae bacterium]|nr:hypothetical protein [Anaerolineae bacterium]
MRIKILLFTGFACLLLAGYMLIGKNTSEPSFRVSGIPYPENYRETFFHYATVDRSDGTIRDLYI